MADELIDTATIEEVPEEIDVFDGWDDDPDEDSAEITEETEATEQDTEEADDVTDQFNDDAEAEEPTETTEATETETENEQKEETADQPKTYQLKHLDEVQELTAEQMIPLAQKGLDYDRIREERDTMREAWPKLKELEKFAAEMLQNSKGYNTVEELIDDARAEWLVKSEAGYGRPLARQTALERVKGLREESIKSATPKAEPKVPTEKELADKRDSAIREFCEDYPAADVKAIPSSVWNEFRETGNLSKAYAKHLAESKDSEIANLKKEIETLKNNNKNKARSTGSMKSTGAGSVKEAMFDGWDD